MQNLSIIIVNWNGARLLRQCLQSIFEDKNISNSEVIVVDNASSDNSAGMVNQQFPQVKLLINERNLGFARANNQGIKASRGKYILLLNPDTLVYPDTLNQMVIFMDNHPDAGAVGCQLLNSDGTIQPSCRQFPTPNSLINSRFFPGSKTSRQYLMTSWKHDDTREVDQPMGACQWSQQKVIEEIGLLDERFFMFFEEVDWCYRIKKRGWKIYFLSDCKITHFGSQSVSKVWHIMGCEYKKSAYLFFKKHRIAPLQTQLFRLGLTMESSILIPMIKVRSLRNQHNKTQSEAIRSQLSVIKTLWNS